jgi:deoxycytidylate deaminase
MKKAPPRSVPPWDDYYMALTYIIASRSKDPSTQIGAIVVDQDNRPLGIGYNGAPQPIPDDEINWTRPDKYVFIEHAEINAMDHASRGIHTLAGCTIYVSAMPCPNCMRRIVSCRIKRVVYGKTLVNMLADSVVQETRNMASLSKYGVQLEPYQGNISWLRDRMDWLENNLPEIFFSPLFLTNS